jgi:hypothetical protein
VAIVVFSTGLWAQLESVAVSKNNAITVRPTPKRAPLMNISPTFVWVGVFGQLHHATTYVLRWNGKTTLRSQGPKLPHNHPKTKRQRRTRKIAKPQAKAGTQNREAAGQSGHAKSRSRRPKRARKVAKPKAKGQSGHAKSRSRSPTGTSIIEGGTWTSKTATQCDESGLTMAVRDVARYTTFGGTTWNILDTEFGISSSNLSA